MNRSALRDAVTLAGLLLLLASIWWFAEHAIIRGYAGLSGDTEAMGRFSGGRVSNAAIFTHMLFGGIISVFAVFQLAGPVRQRWPWAHRLSGRVLAVLAFLTGAGGLIYITFQGTIGGPQMSAGFALYGFLMVIAAVQTPRMAMTARFERHRRWGTRLIVLCIASWLYRVHYGVFYAVFCTEGSEACAALSTPEFTGAFDRIQNWAFFVPYLVLAEIWVRVVRRPDLAPKRLRQSD